MNIDKGDFIALLNEFGSEISTAESSFKGIYVPLQSAKQLLDVKLEPGDAVVYTDPATSLTLGEMLSFQGKSFTLVSNSKIQYINGNPIYLELGIQRFLPNITVPGEYRIRTCSSLLLSSEYEISEEIFGLAVPSSYDIPTPVSASFFISSGYEISEELFSLSVPASYDLVQEIFGLSLPSVYNIPTPESGSLLLSASYDIAEGIFELSVPSAYDIPTPVSGALLLSASYDIAEEIFGLSVPSAYNIPTPVSGALLLSAEYDIAEGLFELSVSAVYDITEELFDLAVPSAYNIPTPESGSLLLSSEYEISEEFFTLSVPASYDLLAPTAISGLRAEFIAPDAVVLHWNALDPADADYYEIYRSTSSGFTPSSSTFVGISRVNSFRNRDLDTDTTYYFKVRAVDPDGNAGAFSSQVYATTSGTS
jgi:hypothetical protein